MKKKRLLIFLLILIALLPLVFLIIKPALNYMSGYLSKTEQVKANILIVEGWLPDYDLDIACQEFQKNGYDYIITSGLKYSTDYYRLSSNGYLIFYPGHKLAGITAPGEHSIEVNAYSELGGSNRAHFNLFINDSLKADFLTETKVRNYGMTWKGDLSRIDSIIIQYDNESRGKYGYRNLCVKEIIVDHKIVIPYLNNSVYDLLKLDGKQRIVNDYDSNAELARKWLVSMGIDPSRVIATSGERVIMNRTLTSALALRDWLKTSNINITGINILSVGIHARRTWMTYNKILKEKYVIGIISLPDQNYSRSRIKRILKTVRETLGIIYYWIILIPY
jgi:hypothetical protein